MKSIHDHRYVQLVEILTKSRMELQITQTELAKRLTRPQSYVAKVENLDRRIDIVELVDWLNALGVRSEDFLARLPWW